MIRNVGILGLAGYEPDPARLSAAVDYFSKRGHSVSVAPEPDAHQHRFAGSVSQRIAALNQMVSDPEIDLIVGLRGGYGISRLLDQIDFPAVASAVRTRGLRIVGHSDWTAFQLGLLASTGAVSFGGPMASFGFGGESVDPFTEEHFWAVMNTPPHTDSPGHSASFAVQGPDCNVSGTLWGGNLTMVCSLLGTPWMPRIDGGILFLEDVNEHPYRVERMLLQLRHAGILEAQAAVLLGAFSAYKLTPYDQGYDIPEVVDHLRTVTSTPLITGLPYGHVPQKLTLPVGGQAHLAVEGEVAQLALSGYPSS